MPSLSPTRLAVLAALAAGLGCAGNRGPQDQAGAARDSTITAKVDSTTNQTESGVTDSSGRSTLPQAEKTRPDQGQPVTSKGDTLNQGVDSTTAR